MKIPTRERDALKRHDMRAVKQRAQARLNRAAVAWCRIWADTNNDSWAVADRPVRAVRAFQKINASQTKGNK